jgi:branched-chain amino acid transport system ATP-binding protein
MLELCRISASYGRIEAIHEISLKIRQGEIIALIGANGAGKSTTLMTISGIVRCRSGTILFGGKPIHELPADRIVALGISQVPEGRHIFPDLTVAENLHLGAFLRKNRTEIMKDLDTFYTLFPILKQRRHQLGGNLSGGEQQMLAISRALMARPGLLLLDEPSMGLAPIITKKIFSIIKKINQEHGTTILLVEQNANLALKIADRGYVLENGKIVLHDRAESLLKNKDVQKAYLGL